MQLFALRLRPGQDLGIELSRFVQENGLQAAFVLTCVGSLRQAALRLANRPETTLYEDKFEIVSLVGTLDAGGYHLHISLSDGQGRTMGGHLMTGCLVYTTAEIVIGEADGLLFSRPFDPETGYPELEVTRR
ncbi:MAG: DNA-binding protein [Anaerolineae bacterium]|nr:DNA-binding protein [Anaerolineae bacterium]